MMRPTAALFMVAGFAALTMAYDIPVPVTPQPLDAQPASGMTAMAAIIGGSLLALSFLLGGIWISRQRKGNEVNR